MEQELVGRDVEVARILALIDQTPDGGGALIVTGEPGIGKSALLRVAADHARNAGFCVLETAGVESESRLPYSSLNQLLGPVLDVAERLPAAQRRALAVALGLEDGDPPDPFLVALAVLNLLSELAAERPALVVVDDAQWLDEPSRDALTFLVRRVNRDAIALLGALRTGSRRLEVPDMPVLDVEPLDDSAARELLARRGEDLSAVERERILQEALGNPLALVELPAAWRGGRHPPADGLLPLTQRLERAFVGRISELPSLTRDALLVAAIDGDDQLPEILAATANLAGEHVGVGDLDSAVAAGLLRFDELRVRFRHPLVRSAVLQAEPMARAQRAHAALASVLADGYRRIWHRAHAIVEPDDDVADDLDSIHRTVLARGSVVSAIRALERASQLTTDPVRRARRLLTAAEFAFDLGRADTVDRLLQEASRLPLSELDRARVAWLREIFNDGVPGDAARVVDLCETARRSADAGETDLAFNLLLAAALRCWWSDSGSGARACVVEVTASVRGTEHDPRHIAALAVAEPVLQAASVTQRLSEVVVETVAEPNDLRLYGAAAHAIGDPVRALDLLSRAEAMFREQGRLALLSQVRNMQTLENIDVGDWSSAAACAEEARRLARDTGQPLWDIAITSLVAMLAGLRGDLERALGLAGEAEAGASSRRLNDLLCCVQLARGFAWISTGHHTKAYDHLRRVFDPDDPAFHLTARFHGVTFLAEAAVHAGQVDDARSVVAGLELEAKVTPSPTLHIGLSYAVAVLAPDDEAEALYLAALGQDLVRWPWARGRLELAYGCWLRRQRRSAESRPLLRSALTTLEVVGATTWADQARVELRAAGERPQASAPAAHEALSPQELQIALLATEGLSNKEIGERLYMSHRTVGSHLYRIFPKLDITSRAQLASRLSST